MTGTILFLDLARTTGWCEGPINERPLSGTVRLAPEGAPPAAVFGGMLDFLATRLTALRYRMIVYEAPMDPRHLKTNLNTARILLGLPAIVEAVAYQTGHFSVREANVNDVRRDLLGFIPRRAKGERGQAQKSPVVEAVQARGFDPRDDNEADAIAGWLFAVAQLNKRELNRRGQT